ncbi:hypothetical protein [Rhodococcus qingshengii]|nr:hypothetical protein [Rhodococcus qingshengii]WCT05837.1 hypothetical protein PI247_30680 [Rhodococcus qingshengii]
MTTEKDTSKPGWKAHTVVALISLAVGIIVLALRLRRELDAPAEENGRP